MCSSDLFGHEGVGNAGGAGGDGDDAQRGRAGIDRKARGCCAGCYRRSSGSSAFGQAGGQRRVRVIQHGLQAGGMHREAPVQMVVSK